MKHKFSPVICDKITNTTTIRHIIMLRFLTLAIPAMQYYIHIRHKGILLLYAVFPRGSVETSDSKKCDHIDHKDTEFLRESFPSDL